MKKTVFLVVLAVLALVWFMPVEAKFIAEQMNDSNFRIIEVPDSPPIKAILPPLPPEIILNEEQIVETYQLFLLTKQSYHQTKNTFVLTSALPPLTKKNIVKYEISLVDSGKINWKIKEISRTETVPIVNWFLTLPLAMLLLGILVNGIRDRLDGRKTKALLLFYFSAILTTGVYSFLPAGSYIIVLATISMVSWAFSMVYLQTTHSTKISQIIGGCAFFFISIAGPLFFGSVAMINLESTSQIQQELIILFVTTDIISFLIGEIWYHLRKNRHYESIVIPQTNT